MFKSFARAYMNSRTLINLIIALIGIPIAISGSYQYALQFLVIVHVLIALRYVFIDEVKLQYKMKKQMKELEDNNA